MTSSESARPAPAVRRGASSPRKTRSTRWRDRQREERAKLNLALLGQGGEVIAPLFSEIDRLRDEILARGQGTTGAVRRRLAALSRRLEGFEASVTLLGQAGAGKTSLVNLLAGHPGLLPTGETAGARAVSALHLNARLASRRTRARFRFAGKGDGVSASGHRFSHVDPELIARYLGEPAAKPRSTPFATLTRAAEIWLDCPELPGSYLLRDMPGVSEDSLPHGQGTMQSLRGSKVCVVVLSAHKALNSTDLALVRLIANYDSRQVILFINRIDELASPCEQVEQIYHSITSALRPYGRLRDVKMVFGSARWAERALCNDTDMPAPQAAARLAEWARNCDVAADPGDMADLWKLSGLPELMRSINELVVNGSGARHLAVMRGGLADITAAAAAREAVTGGRESAARLAGTDPEQLRAELDALAQRARQKLEEVLARLDDGLTPALDQVREDYLARAVASLSAHLGMGQNGDSWSFNSSGLRLVLRTTCDRFSARARAQVETVFHTAASDYSGICRGLMGADIAGLQVLAPQLPKAPQPVLLGQTISLTPGSYPRQSWWQRLWQGRPDPDVIAGLCRDQIAQSVGTVIAEMRESQLSDVLRGSRSLLDTFLHEEAEAVMEMLAEARGLSAGQAALSPEEFQALVSRMVEKCHLGAVGSLRPDDDPAMKEGAGKTEALRRAVGF